MTNFSSPHHSFDIELASKYGITEAILIHHFQHWIGVNKRLNRNFKEGKTWTYQTFDEISAHFPYLTKEEVRGAIERLCTGKGRRSESETPSFEPVLIKKNFNKIPFDRTIWYAFSNNFNEREISQIGNGSPPTPIPDTKTHTKKEEKREPTAPCSHPEAGNVSILLVEAIKKTKPDIKEPNFHSTHQEIDKMLRLDKRSVETVVKVLEWLPTSQFWSKNILSAAKLREKFDQLELQMSEKPKNTASDDLGLVKKLKKHLDQYPNKNVEIGADYVDFVTLRDSYYKCGEPGFKEKVSNALRKIGLPLQG